ncbi:MAG: class I SAM-dependent methyltransferase [Pseudoxanthomonas sp.]
MSEEAACKSSYFDELYHGDDPFGYRTRWYEERKRQILGATLPQRSFERGWEIGCSNGELTASLAARCRSLLATDLSRRAVDLARARNREHGHVQVECANHPKDWPGSSFDLIVLSEIGYYLEAEDLDETIGKIQASLSADGVFVACHWLAPFDEAPLTGRQVHSRIEQLLSLQLTYRYEDSDFLLEAWSSKKHTLAELEGLK